MTHTEITKPMEVPEVAWIPNTVSPQDILIAKACGRRARAINRVIDERLNKRLAIEEEETVRILHKYGQVSLMDLTTEQTKEWQDNIDDRTAEFPNDTIADVIPPYTDYL